MKQFEWVDHTADVGFRAYGHDIEEAFENAALALTEIITDADKVRAEKDISIEIEAEDLEALLFDWLGYFLYLFDAKNLIMSKFEISEISSKNDEFKLEAKAWGEEFDRERHGYGTEVKAITYHMMEINCSPEQCSVQVIVDI
ncbi:hypothetical protein AKJ62_03830 [candidate division MSBL1 archaeon SCGC-AAA259D14]|uniref:Protein archease n=1 Tax=candidate division MSBL1 archaeon SCGC-AAA259D14 TaxID=1698261 RepID=A0A133U4I1_9EURY|nr:hypothetical protein AKJ62_03830 [candidate division MSBL1 archaeon SCGC-AAA259D14]